MVQKWGGKEVIHGVATGDAPPDEEEQGISR